MMMMNDEQWGKCVPSISSYFFLFVVRKFEIMNDIIVLGLSFYYTLCLFLVLPIKSSHVQWLQGYVVYYLPELHSHMFIARFNMLLAPIFRFTKMTSSQQTTAS